MLFIYLLVALAQIRIRNRIELASPGKLAFKVWLFPYSSYLTIAGIAAVLLAMALTPAHATEFYASALLLMLVLVAYFVLRWKRTVVPA